MLTSVAVAYRSSDAVLFFLSTLHEAIISARQLTEAELRLHLRSLDREQLNKVTQFLFSGHPQALATVMACTSSDDEYINQFLAVGLAEKVITFEALRASVEALTQRCTYLLTDEKPSRIAGRARDADCHLRHSLERGLLARDAVIAGLRHQLHQTQALAHAATERITALEREVERAKNEVRDSVDKLTDTVVKLCLAAAPPHQSSAAASTLAAAIVAKPSAPPPSSEIFDHLGRPDKVWQPAQSDKDALVIKIASRIDRVMAHLTQFANMKDIVTEAMVYAPARLTPGARCMVIMDKMLSMRVGVEQLCHALSAVGLHTCITYVNKSSK